MLCPRVTEGLHLPEPLARHLPSWELAPGPSVLRPPHGCLQRGSLGTLDGGGIEASVAPAAPPHIGDLAGITWRASPGQLAWQRVPAISKSHLCLWGLDIKQRISSEKGEDLFKVVR